VFAAGRLEERVCAGQTDETRLLLADLAARFEELEAALHEWRG
jgi:hypothetical protein